MESLSSVNRQPLTKTLQLLVFCSMSFSIQSSVAGDFLHLQTGKINTKLLSQQVFSQVNDLNESDRKFYVVQFDEKISQADREELEEFGFRSFHYLPDDALIVEGSEKAAFWVGAKKTIVPYASEWKIIVIIEWNSWES